MTRPFKWIYSNFGINRDPKPIPEPGIQLFGELIAGCHEVLAKSTGSEPPVYTIRARDIRPVIMQVDCFGKSAVFTRWASSDDGKANAITLLLSGMNEDEDDLARKQAKEEMLRFTGDRHGVIKLTIAKLGEEPKPLAATICMNETAYDDPVTFYAAGALACAFYE